MSLKYEVEKLDDIDEPLRALYKKEGGKFRLNVDGIPKNDSGELAEQLHKLRENNKALLDEKKKANEAAEKAALEAAKKSGDIEALEKSWSEKLQTTVSAKDQEIQTLQGMISNLTVGSTATSIAAELFGEHAELMLPHVNGRLKVEISDGQPRVRVLDAAGNLSAMSVDDLKAEIRGNAKFAAFVVGSKASGSGQPGKPAGGGAIKKFNEYSATELSEIRRKDPTTYERLKAEYQKAGGR